MESGTQRCILTKFRNNFQTFQNKFRNDTSMVSLLADFIKVFQTSAEAMKCRPKRNVKLK